MHDLVPSWAAPLPHAPTPGVSSLSHPGVHCIRVHILWGSWHSTPLAVLAHCLEAEIKKQQRYMYEISLWEGEEDGWGNSELLNASTPGVSSRSHPGAHCIRAHILWDSWHSTSLTVLTHCLETEIRNLWKYSVDGQERHFGLMSDDWSTSKLVKMILKKLMTDLSDIALNLMSTEYA